MNDSPQSTFASYLKIITRRWWLFLLLPVVTVVAIWAIGSTAEPEYVAYERLQIIPSDAQLVTLFSRTPTLTTEQQIQSVHDDFYDVVRLPAVAWKTIADLNLNMSASELIDRIDTEHFSTFITVSARMPEPELARDVVTVHTQNAIEYLRKIRVNPAEVTKKFLDEQVAQQEQVLAQARLALQQFQLEHEVSDLPKEIAAAEDMKRVLTAERDRLLAQAAQAEALAAQYDKMAEANRAKAAELTSLLPRTLITNTAAITDTTGVELPDEVLTTQQQIENLTALAAAQARQAQEQKALAAGKRAAAEDYNRIINERQQEIIFLLGLQEQYQALLNRLNQAQGTYDFLVDKANEANLKVVQGSTVGYLEVVSPARTPTAPAPKHLWQLMLVGILSSLLLALLLAFLIEILERHLLRK